NATAMAVLAVLAGVRPVASIARRPAAGQGWLQALVEALADERLDRAGAAREASAALAEVASLLGQAAPAALSGAYVGVLATRFRHAIFGPRGGGAQREERGPCNVPARG
ncbi:MAG: hypothetical protein NTY65_06430, partial [Planctomycetota bacterium]|nr:hypothetical protein [Planctomycetota bacterium]